MSRFGFLCKMLAFFGLLATVGLSWALQKSYESTVPDVAAFERLQRTYTINQEKRPHILFIADRRLGKIYYAYSRQFSFHRSFAKTLGLAGEDARSFFRQNYVDTDRRLLIGTVGLLPETGDYYWEYSDRNIIDSDIYTETQKFLQDSFYAPIKFRPNSTQHERIRLAHPGIAAFTLADFASDRQQEVYFEKRRTGILKYIPADDPDPSWESHHIVVFDEAPVHVTPLQGIITTQPSSPLAHIHLLARSWQVPDMYWSNVRYGRFVDKWVTLDTSQDPVVLNLASQDEVNRVQWQQAQRENERRRLPAADLDDRTMASLAEQLKSDSIRYGFKAANLGHLTTVSEVAVPRGYSIPFAYYDAFMREHGLDVQVQAVLQSSANDELPMLLQALRESIMSQPINADDKQAMLDYHRTFFKTQAVFVRSSTNAEDSPGFSGAGLYTSVPNVVSDDELLQAIKRVWASVWNERAYRARELHGLDHQTVYASVLVQRAMAADAAGVLVTTNPYNRYTSDGLLINAKKGLGIKVVDGNRVPEQIIFDRNTQQAIVLSRSTETTQLVLAAEGGVEEAPITTPTTVVLTPELIQRLVAVAERIQSRFDGVPQDIEWLVVGDQLWIVQSRPFL